MTRRGKEIEALPLNAQFQEAFSNLRAGYDAGTNSRFRPQPFDTAPSGSGADYHYRQEGQYLRMVERSRYFDRNNMVVAQGIDRAIANIIQDGYVLHPDTGDTNTDKRIKDMWDAWECDAEQVDLEGEMDWNEKEKITLRAVFVDGDVQTLPLTNGKIQTSENHRLRTPRNTRMNVVHGIKLSDKPNEYGKRLEYWFTKEDLNPNQTLTRVSEMRKIPARDADGNRNVLHCYNPRRVSQRRGVTLMAPVVDVTGMHDDVQFAKLVQQQVASCYAILEEVDANAPTRPGGAGIVTGEQTVTELADGSTRTVEGIAPGMRIKGAPGHRLTGFSPNIPNAEFFPHATLLLSFISINLGLPVAVLMLDPSNTNFSGWRGAIDQARLGFRSVQRFYRAKHHRPLYLWKLRQFLQVDEFLQRKFVELGTRFFQHSWNPPGWQYIEPMKDAAADDLQLSRNLTSPRRRSASRGMHWPRLAAEIVEDRALLIEYAVDKAAAMNKATPGLDPPIDWREIAYGQQSTGITYVFGSNLGDEPNKPAESKPEKANVNGNIGSNGHAKRFSAN